MKKNLVSTSVLALMVFGTLAVSCTKDDVSSPSTESTVVAAVETPEAVVYTTPPTASNTARTITATIVVKAGTTYDGRGERITAVGLGDGGQGESQKPIFKLEKGAKLSNVILTAPGADGVHCYGDNYVYNVVWEDVGEDALTAKGSGWITVDGGRANSAADKVFQLNQPCTFTVKNFTATTFGKVIRQNGGTGFKCTIYIDNCTFRGNNSECVARTDSPTTQLYHRRMTASSVKTLWIFPSTSQIHTF